MRSLLLACAVLTASTVSAFNWDVNVGEGGNLTFSPPTVSGAVPGDTVTYHFFAKVSAKLSANSMWNEDISLISSRIIPLSNHRSKIHAIL